MCYVIVQINRSERHKFCGIGTLAKKFYFVGQRTIHAMIVIMVSWLYIGNRCAQASPEHHALPKKKNMIHI